jgi:hypothetical protein
MREYIEELEAHARRLERQRDEWQWAFLLATKRAGDAGELLVELKRQLDELLDIANRAVSALDGNLRCEETCKCSGRHQISELRAAISAMKGGRP